MSRTVLRASWLAVGVLALVALVLAATGDRGDVTTEDRAYRLAQSLACPVCQGQSVGESDVPVAREIRAEIRRRIEAGQTDDEIRGFLVDTYDEDIDYSPSTSGVTGLVWILPPVAAAAAVAGLVAAFHRWRTPATVTVSAADRELVAAARRSGHAGDGGAERDDDADGGAGP